MNPTDARLSLAGRNQNERDRPEFQQIVDDARRAVTARAADLNQKHAVSDPPEVLMNYIQQLQQNPASAQYFAEGWVVRIADLRRICSFQPHVFTEDAAQRVAAVEPGDLGAVARVTLPLQSRESIAAAFDPVRNAWVFNSGNPNLRVVGPANGEGPIGGVFGFVVGVSGSFMQVASFRGRLVLRDGYHRALGLISRDIFEVPVFYREFETFEDLRVPQGMLPQDAYLGDRPPLLIDYLNSAVSAITTVPAMQKVVVVQALEIATLG
jgi:hypothetical protein